MQFKKIPIVFHNGSKYEGIIIKIIKELAEEFKKRFLFRGNTEKYITSTVLIDEEVTTIDKNGKKLQKIYLTYYKYNILYILHIIIDHAGFMASSLSNLLINFFEGIHRIKCKYWHN